MKIVIKKVVIHQYPNEAAGCACGSPNRPSTERYDLRTVEDWFSSIVANLPKKNRPGQADGNTPSEALD